MIQFNSVLVVTVNYKVNVFPCDIGSSLSLSFECIFRRSCTQASKQAISLDDLYAKVDEQTIGFKLVKFFDILANIVLCNTKNVRV